MRVRKSDGDRHRGARSQSRAWPEKAEAPRGISPRGFLDRLRGADQRVTSKYFANFS